MIATEDYVVKKTKLLNLLKKDSRTKLKSLVLSRRSANQDLIPKLTVVQPLSGM